MLAACPDPSHCYFIYSLPWYIGKMISAERNVNVERVQTGVRLEKRLLKVLKGLAELKDLSLGDLLEGIVLHAFEGKAPFSAQTLKQIEQLRSLYGLTLRSSDSHRLKEHK
jgi:hypothetical protein